VALPAEARALVAARERGAEGTNPINRMIIARQILKVAGSVLGVLPNLGVSARYREPQAAHSDGWGEPRPGRAAESRTMDMPGGRRFDRWPRLGRVTRSGLAVATAVFVTVALSSGCSTPPTSAGHSTTLPSSSAPTTAALPVPAPATSRTVVTALPSHRASTPPATSKAQVVIAPTTAAPPVQPTPAPAPGCHPLTNSGKCYEPGEFCRNADHGASGVAGDGEAITCANNDGWRWEPS
jgi:hypothetical protein